MSFAVTDLQVGQCMNLMCTVTDSSVFIYLFLIFIKKVYGNVFILWFNCY